MGITTCFDSYSIFRMDLLKSASFGIFMLILAVTVQAPDPICKQFS